MATVSETLALGDRVTGPANKMAASVGKVASSLDRARASANKLGTQQARLAQQQQKAIERQKAKEAVAFKASGAAHARSEQGDKKAIASSAAIVAGIVAVGTAAVATAVKVGQIVASLIEATAEAHATRQSVIAMLTALKTKDAPKALEAIDRFSLKLGLSLEEGRKQFVELGKAGKTASEIAGIMKMRADLIAVTGSAEMADEKLKPVLEAKGPGATAAALAKVGKEAGVAGDGVAAATKRMNTFAGATERIKNAPARIFDQLAKSAGPALDKLGGKINKLLDDFQKSPEGAAAIGAVAAALTTVIDVVSELIPLVMPFIKGFAEGLKPVTDALGPIAKAISKAFGGDNQDKMSTAAKIGRVVGAAFGIAAIAIGIVAAAVAAVAAPFILAGVAVGILVYALTELVTGAGRLASELPSMIGSAVNRAKAYLMLLQDQAGETANQLIQGLVDGISGGVGRVVAAVKGLGGAVKKAFSDSIEAKSPSKLMKRLGSYIPAGLAIGISGGKSKVAQASAGLGSTSATGVASGASGGGGSAVVNINVTAGPGATRGDAELTASVLLPIIRREVTSIMRGRAAEFG